MAVDVARYGPDIPTEAELRLCGNVEGKRVLELGLAAQAAIAFAKQGAHAIGLDPSQDLLNGAKRWSEREGVKVELHHGDLADLAFIRADTVDAAFSDGAFRRVDDLDRVFRQVHRVLRTDAPFLVSLPHPTMDMIDTSVDPVALSERSYFDRSDNRRTVGDLFTALGRAHFGVDTLLEPEAGSMPWTLILRGRKLGN
jgi:ubiquinone/menaquinone biosynthesis C-methylase UbiE